MASRAPVLVAEDEPQLRRLLARILEGAGYEVVLCSDGDELVRALEQRGALGVAVVDASIEPGGAAAVVEALAGREAPTAFVVTTGDVLPESLTSLVHSHGGVVLRKPFAPRALLSAVAAAQGGAEAR